MKFVEFDTVSEAKIHLPIKKIKSVYQYLVVCKIETVNSEEPHQVIGTYDEIIKKIKQADED